MARDNTAGRLTTKAKRKTHSARVTAQGLATLGNAKARRKSDEAQPLPEADTSGSLTSGSLTGDETYVAKEHMRKDTGSRILVLDLLAPDAPDDALPPFADAEGQSMRFAVVCETHGGTPRFYATYQQAYKVAKESHHWCEGCQRALSGKAKSRNMRRPR